MVILVVVELIVFLDFLVIVFKLLVEFLLWLGLGDVVWKNELVLCLGDFVLYVVVIVGGVFILVLEKMVGMWFEVVLNCLLLCDMDNWWLGRL